MSTNQSAEAPSQSAQSYIDVETGSRDLSGAVGRFVIALLIAWSCFQLWYASPLPFILKFGTFNEDQAKFIHLAFASFLAFCLFPFSKRSSKQITIPDIAIGLIAASTALYLLVFRDELVDRIGCTQQTSGIY